MAAAGFDSPRGGPTEAELHDPSSVGPNAPSHSRACSRAWHRVASPDVRGSSPPRTKTSRAHVSPHDASQERTFVSPHDALSLPKAPACPRTRAPPYAVWNGKRPKGAASCRAKRKPPEAAQRTSQGTRPPTARAPRRRLTGQRSTSTNSPRSETSADQSKRRVHQPLALRDAGQSVKVAHLPTARAPRHRSRNAPRPRPHPRARGS